MMAEHESLQPLSGTELEFLEEATSRYEAGLAGDKTMQSYLTGPTRGLEVNTVRSARLGRVIEPMANHERFEGWLAIPYLGIHGEVLKIRFRCTQEHDHKAASHSKYADIKHAHTRMYNVPAVLDAEDFIAVCEGELDALVLEQIGIPAVAIPGAAAWKPHYRRILQGFDKLFVFGDPDDAGREFNIAVQKSLRQAVAVKLDMDVTDTVLSNGAGAIYDALGLGLD